MSRPHTPTFAAPYPSAILQPRAVLFECGVLTVDVLRLGAPPLLGAMAEGEGGAAAAAAASAVSAAATPAAAASSAAPAAAGPLSSHPIRSLTYGPRAAAISSPPPRRPLPQARLDALHAACRADRAAAGRSGLSFGSWMKQAAAHFGASGAQARAYWECFVATHRSSYTATAAGSPPAGAARSPVTALLAPPLLHTEVDLQEFFLFLFAQRYARFKAAYSSNSSSSGSNERKDTLSSIASACSNGAACVGVEAQKAFLVQHLPSLLTLCKDDGCPTPESEAASASSSANFGSMVLSAREVDRLSILVQGVPHPLESREAASLSSLTPFFQPASAAPAASSTSAATSAAGQHEQTVSFLTLMTWLSMQLHRPALSLSLSLSLSSEDAAAALLLPDSNSPRLGPGKPCTWLPLLPHIELRSMRDRNVFLRRPRPSEAQPDVSVAASSCGATAPTADHASIERVVASGGLLHVHHSSGLSVYANLVHRFVRLSHLSHCTLHLGVVTHLTRIDHCSHCVIYLVAPEGAEGAGRGIAHAVQISHCDNVKIFLWTQGCVQLLHARRTKTAGRAGAAAAAGGAAGGIGGFSLADLTGADVAPQSDAFEGAESEEPNNSGLVLAPYNTAYPELVDDLRAIGAEPTGGKQRNSWAAFSILEPIELPRAAASTNSHSNTNSSASASAASAPSKPTHTLGVAAGGRKSKTAAQALAGGSNQPNLLLGGSSAVAPIFQTFPALLPTPAASTASTPAGSAASSPAFGPLASPAAPPAIISSAAAVSSEVVSLMAPRDFFPCVQPVAPSTAAAAASATSSAIATPAVRNPFDLPPAFSAALVDRQAQALANRSLISRALLGPAQSTSLHCMIQAEFELWMQMHKPAGFLANLQRVEQERNQALHKQRAAATLQMTAQASAAAADMQSSAASNLLQQQLAYARKNRV